MHQASRINITCNHLGTLDKFEPRRSYGAKFTFYFLTLYLGNEDFTVSIENWKKLAIFQTVDGRLDFTEGMGLRINR